MSEERPFRWAILGTGMVARKFVLSLNALGGKAIATSVASRNPENAVAFAKTLGIATAAPNWEDAVTADIDAVYIATPAAHHEAHALIALAKGKPVLIEKPLGPDADTARRIAKAAEAADVFAMEALWTRFLPLIRQAKQLADGGALGQISGFHGTFMIANRPDPNVSLFDPARAGGALLHRGIYPLSLARHFCGPITSVSAAGRIGPTGVDTDAAMIVTHASGATSTLRASLCHSGSNAASLWGTQARIDLAAPIWRPASARLILERPASPLAEGVRRLERFRETHQGQVMATMLARLRALKKPGRALDSHFLGNGYAHEALAFMEAVKAGQSGSDIMPLVESIEILSAIDEARAMIRGAMA